MNSEKINEGVQEIRFPAREELTQDEEWCEIRRDEDWQRLRFHDYEEIYAIPGLYEQLFYDRLQCTSPRRVVSLLHETLREREYSPDQLRVLDVGAGNGMAGEQLREIGAAHLTGVDIIPAARAAALRDRPGLYDDYLVADLCALSPDQQALLERARCNCLVTVAALGFGDIPPSAFATAFNLIETSGYIAFNIKEDFLEGGGKADFSGLVRRLVFNGIIRVEAYQRYRHRLAASGEPLYYSAIIATKMDDIPDQLVEHLDD